MDLPIKDFMRRVYEFSDLGMVKKIELQKFLQGYAKEYAMRESTNEILIPMATLTMDAMYKTLEKIFNCMIKTTRPKKDGTIEMSRVELLWKEREYYNSENHNENVFILEEFLDMIVDNQKIDIEN